MLRLVLVVVVLVQMGQSHEEHKIGTTIVELKGLDDVTGTFESNLGDVIADAFVNSWDDTEIGLVANQGLTNRSVPAGDILPHHLSGIFHMQNETVDRVLVLGQTILDSIVPIAKSHQVSGLKIMLGAPQPAALTSEASAESLSSIQVHCGSPKHECSPINNEEWCEFEPERVYVLALASSESSTLFPNTAAPIETGNIVQTAVENYISNCSPLRQTVQGRITCLDHMLSISTNAPTELTQASCSAIHNPNSCLCFVILLLLLKF